MQGQSPKPAAPRAQAAADGHDLEAGWPLVDDTLQGMLRDAIHDVLDRELFDKEQQQEQEDAVFLSGARGRIKQALAGTIEGGGQ